MFNFGEVNDMISSENEPLRGKGASADIDYRCFDNYKLSNMFEEDEKSNDNKNNSVGNEPKPH